MEAERAAYLQVSVAAATLLVVRIEIIAGTVVAPTQVATPAVMFFALLIGALIGSDETHVKLCGLGIT